MGKRKPAANTEKPSNYKDAWRHFFACDAGHRFTEDWDRPFARSHGRCNIDGCDAWVELAHCAPETRTDDPATDGDPFQLVQIPSDAPVLQWQPPESVASD